MNSHLHITETLFWRARERERVQHHPLQKYSDNQYSVSERSLWKQLVFSAQHSAFCIIPLRRALTNAERWYSALSIRTILQYYLVACSRYSCTQKGWPTMTSEVPDYKWWQCNHFIMCHLLHVMIDCPKKWQSWHKCTEMKTYFCACHQYFKNIFSDPCIGQGGEKSYQDNSSKCFKNLAKNVKLYWTVLSEENHLQLLSKIQKILRGVIWH